MAFNPCNPVFRDCATGEFSEAVSHQMAHQFEGEWVSQIFGNSEHQYYVRLNSRRSDTGMNLEVCIYDALHDHRQVACVRDDMSRVRDNIEYAFNFPDTAPFQSFRLKLRNGTPHIRPNGHWLFKELVSATEPMNEATIENSSTR